MSCRVNNKMYIDLCQTPLQNCKLTIFQDSFAIPSSIELFDHRRSLGSDHEKYFWPRWDDASSSAATLLCSLLTFVIKRLVAMH